MQRATTQGAAFGSGGSLREPREQARQRRMISRVRNRCGHSSDMLGGQLWHELRKQGDARGDVLDAFNGGEHKTQWRGWPAAGKLDERGCPVVWVVDNDAGGCLPQQVRGQ